jgi:hypothetical protein
MAYLVIRSAGLSSAAPVLRPIGETDKVDDEGDGSLKFEMMGIACYQAA